MLQSIPSFDRLAADQEATPGLALTQRLTLWLLGCWLAACRHAERADRIVPYY